MIAHRHSTATENHRLPGFEFASLGAAQAHVYASSDVSFMVRVGAAAPYEYYMISQVVAGVATLVNLGGVENGGYFDVFDPDAPAASPHAHDDNASSGVISPAWTLWDPGAILTASAAGGRYRLVATGSGGSHFGGYYRAIPAGEFQFSARVGLEAPSTGTQAAALLLFDDIVTNPSTADFRVGGVRTSAGTPSIVHETRAAYDGGTVAGSVGASITYVPSWFRMRMNGTSVSVDYSLDGWNWLLASTTTLAFTPSYYGWGLNVVTGSQQAAASFQHFRVLSGAGSSAFLAGVRGRNVRRLITP